METIFDFNPTGNELKAIGIDSLNLSMRHGVEVSDPITDNNYKVSQEDAYFDIALLLEYRNDKDRAAEYWAMIPDRHSEYLLGFDFESIAE
ncbi:MAG: hypothetical protein BGO31_14265 [Bacteroidetes bacterium 43-16]|nr:MAG: hypothetical protein BGO31_14265 [Bacteroidetes bacterium 43-16]